MPWVSTPEKVTIKLDPDNFQDSQERRGSYGGKSRAEPEACVSASAANPILKQRSEPKSGKEKVKKVSKVRKISAESIDTLCK